MHPSLILISKVVHKRQYLDGIVPLSKRLEGIGQVHAYLEQGRLALGVRQVLRDELWVEVHQVLVVYSLKCPEVRVMGQLLLLVDLVNQPHVEEGFGKLQRVDRLKLRVYLGHDVLEVLERSSIVLQLEVQATHVKVGLDVLLVKLKRLLVQLE